MSTLPKTAVAKDGRVLPVLEKDYKQLYELLRNEQVQGQRRKDERYRQQQTARENQQLQQRHPKPGAQPVTQPGTTGTRKESARPLNASPFFHPHYAGPEPGTPGFDPALHGSLAPPRVRNLLHGKYID